MKRFFLCLLVLLLMLGMEFVRSNYTVGVSHYNIAIENLPEQFEGYRILQITDLHSKSFPQLQKSIQRQNPDIIVMTGDMVSSTDREFEIFLNLARQVAPQIPTYFIIGNHEQALPRASLAELTARLADAGVRILDNRAERLTRGDAHVNLYGLWFNLRYYRDKNDAQTQDYIIGERELVHILGEAPHGEVNILLAHNPVYFDAYAAWGADITLAGHMHGGMIRIPFRGGLLSPEKEYFPKYDAGLFECGDSKMLVSRGLGEYAGFRFFNQPEIIVIDLTKKST